MPESLRQIISDDSGQGLAEYGLILGAVALVCIAAVALLGSNVSNMLNSAAADI